MVVKQIVHSPEINQFDWTITFEEQYSKPNSQNRPKYTKYTTYY